MALRPEKMRIAASRRRKAENGVAGKVTDIGYLGDLSIYKVRLDDGFVLKAAVANVTRWSTADRLGRPGLALAGRRRPAWC